MAARVVVVGSINSDDSIRLTRMPAAGETVAAHSVRTTLGGKGANQAIAASRAGAHVQMVGAIGAPDGGGQLAERLATEGIDTSGIAELADSGSGRAIVLVDDAAENSIVVVPGANRSIPRETIERVCEAMRPDDVLLLQHEIPVESSRLAARLARAAGAMVIWNAAPAPTSREDVIADVDLLIVNEHELLAISSLMSTDARDDVASCIDTLASVLDTDVVCTLGSDGAAYRIGRQSGRQSAPIVSAVDTTAAGDTFVGYLAANRTTSFPERLHSALAAASLAVTRRGASDSIPTRAEVDAAIGGPSESART